MTLKDDFCNLEQKIEDVLLTKDYDFFTENRISPEFLKNITISQQRDMLYQDLIIRLHASLFGEQLEEFKITYPATAWDHFKEVAFPTWLKQRYPVKYTTTIWKADAIYEKVSLPDKGPVIRFRKLVDPFLGE